ncbi:MAG: aldo/keto reductase [Anaerolineae bacterium]|nr:aldo/keto reductase [Anaerolineae bacterium]
MQTRELGRTGIQVPVIAVGYWAVADPQNWGTQDEQAAIDAVHAALDVGMTFFDTAPGYGDGASEQLLGRALAGRRDQAIIATKVSRADLAQDRLIASCETSLRDLNTDHIDLYQIHWPSREIPLADSLRALERLRDQGKIRAIGVSNFGPGDLADLLAIGRAESNQLPYSLLFRAIEYDVVPVCQEHRIGILAYSPLLHGLLTGKFTRLDDIPGGRARTRHFSSDRPLTRHGEPGVEDDLIAALDTIRAISAEVGASMAQVALAWALHQPGLTSVIAGARHPDQVRQNAAAADLVLAPDVLAALDQATAAIKAALGPNLDMWQSGNNARTR